MTVEPVSWPVVAGSRARQWVDTPRAVHKLVAESVVYVVCSQGGLDLSLRSTDDVAQWIDDPAAFHAGMAVTRDAAASLIDGVAPAVTAAPLKLAA
jgi:hypothetical protein